MQMKILSLFAAIMSAGLAGAATEAGFEFSKAGFWSVPGSPRRVSSINHGWEFSLDGFKTPAKRVNLPHSIDEGEIGFEASGGVNRQQPAWYRREFSWKKSSARQFLHFEAIMGKSRVTLNGRQVAEHLGGFLPIHAEVTGILKEGRNILEVWCDNSDDPSFPPGKAQRQLDFTYFGGIYRDAYLIETAETYVADPNSGGVYVTSHLQKDGSWLVRADVTLGGSGKGATTELLYDGRRVASPFKPENPALWTPDTPNLHLLEVRVRKGGKVVDSVGVKFGIRDFVLDQDGMTLNGEPYRKMIGANRHQDYLFIGMAMPNSLHWRDVKKFRDCGMTVFRCAHYPQDPAFMDACDALGMFVIVATPGWQFWNDKDPRFGERCLDDIKNMCLRDRSRASLLMWEPILNETRYPGDFASRAVKTVKSVTRAPGDNCSCDAGNSASEEFDVTYGRHKKPGHASFYREWGDFVDNWYAQNSSSRVAWEWGESAMTVQLNHYLYETRWPGVWKHLESRAPFFGATLWHGTDHSRGYHPDNFFGGIMTYGRQKKYSWYGFKSVLSKEPFVHVAHELQACSPREFTILSNCTYKAEWLGEPYVPGVTEFDWNRYQQMAMSKNPEDRQKLFLEISMPDGKKIRKTVAQRCQQLVVALDTEGLPPVADGCDLVACTATFADKDGNPKRYLTDRIVFEVEGPAEIVGENPQQTRWGEAIVLIRPKRAAKPEPITVRARTVRSGEHVKMAGSVTFTPGSAATTVGGLRLRDDSDIKSVGDQQFDFMPTLNK